MTNPLFDTLFKQHHNQNTAFLQMPDGTVVTHGQYLQTAAQYANLFSQLGLQTGDRVVVQVAKSAQALAVYAACVQSGMVFLPLNTAYTSTEVAYFVKDSGARLILCDTAQLPELQPIADASNASLETMNVDGTGSFADKARSMSDNYHTVNDPKAPC